MTPHTQMTKLVSCQWLPQTTWITVSQKNTTVAWPATVMPSPFGCCLVECWPENFLIRLRFILRILLLHSAVIMRTYVTQVRLSMRRSSTNSSIHFWFHSEHSGQSSVLVKTSCPPHPPPYVDFEFFIRLHLTSSFAAIIIMKRPLNRKHCYFYTFFFSSILRKLKLISTHSKCWCILSLFDTGLLFPPFATVYILS